MTLRTARLSEICDINPKMPKSLDDNALASFLPMAAVSEEGRIAFEEERPVAEVKKGYTYFERGDVLVAKITPCFENGKASRTTSLRKPFGFGSTEFHVLRPTNDVDPNFLFYKIWNASFRELGAQNMTGSAGQKRVPVDFLKRLEILLPPLDEQRRIAAILDKADALRRKRKQALDLLKNLTQSVFLEMFGDAITQGAANGKISLGEIFDFKNGVNFSSGDRGRGIPVVDVLNMYSDDIFVSIGNLYRVDLNLRNDMILSEGDLLFVRSSVKREGVGWASLFPGSKEPMTHCGFIIRARPRIEEITFRPHFLVHYLRLPAVRSQLIASAGQVAITNINQERLGHIEVPQVKLSEQESFEFIAKKIEKQVALLKKQTTETEVLFSSLQHRAFSGHLYPSTTAPAFMGGRYGPGARRSSLIIMSATR